jgi:hypothetical protein
MGNYVEFIGYAASAFVLLSFVMKKMILLRIINVIGCSLFVIYGVLLWSFPIILTNVAIVLVNTYFVVRILGKQKE